MAKTKKKQKSILAENIIAGRKNRGWTALKLAEEAKIPYPTLRDIEADMSSGRPETIIKIASALNIQEWELRAPRNEVSSLSLNNQLSKSDIKEVMYEVFDERTSLDPKTESLIALANSIPVDILESLSKESDTYLQSLRRSLQLRHSKKTKAKKKDA